MNNHDAKKEFHEALAEMVEFATVSGNQIDKETIHEYMKDIIEDEAMYAYVYRYLNEMKVNVLGITPDVIAPLVPEVEHPEEDDVLPEKTVEESNEALAFYEMYLDEMHSAQESVNEEAANLLTQLLADHAAASHALSELYLPKVIDLAEKFTGHGLSHSDLVAEGNLALFEAVLSYPMESGENNLTAFEQFVQNRIENTLKNALDEEVGSNRISNHLAEQINALNDVSTELAKDLGREATLEELCEKLALGEDEVKELMKVSINALTVVQTTEEN
jgi:RNA polymerase primary sigma factor